MTFEQAETTDNFLLLRKVSAGGRWELGLYPVMFGVRVRLGLCKMSWCTLDYCGGANPLDYMELLRRVQMILLGVPEEVSEAELCKLFPGFDVKPVILDEACWKKLGEMAALQGTQQLKTA